MKLWLAKLHNMLWMYLHNVVLYPISIRVCPVTPLYVCKLTVKTVVEVSSTQAALCLLCTHLCPAQTYDADVRDVYEAAEAATDKWLSTKRQEEGKQKEARVLGWERTTYVGYALSYIVYLTHGFIILYMYQCTLCT